MSRLRVHQVLAIDVLLAAAAWVLTGKFSHIGSERADAEEAAASQAADAAEPPQRTVLVAEPEPVRYSRSIRLAGRTEPDKTTVLAARDSGISAPCRRWTGTGFLPAR